MSPALDAMDMTLRGKAPNALVPPPHVPRFGKSHIEISIPQDPADAHAYPPEAVQVGPSGHCPILVLTVLCYRNFLPGVSQRILKHQRTTSGPQYLHPCRESRTGSRRGDCQECRLLPGGWAVLRAFGFRSVRELGSKKCSTYPVGTPVTRISQVR